MRLWLYSNMFLTFWEMCMWKCSYDSKVMMAEKEPQAIWKSNNTMGGARYSPFYWLVVGVEEKTNDSFKDGSCLVICHTCTVRSFWPQWCAGQLTPLAMWIVQLPTLGSGCPVVNSKLAMVWIFLSWKYCKPRFLV